ncbi:MAG: response regulator [Lachnospiraceae bacterium]|nr:response regulator [Lachnospiraceae bacterium]
MMETEKDIFLENDVKVLTTVTKIMRWMWVVFPAVLMGNLIGVFQIDYLSLLVLGAASTLILFLPTAAEKLGASIRLRRYLCVLGMGSVVAMLATNPDIGIYLTYGLAMTMSLLFFDHIFTLNISIVSYILIVLSLYARSFGANHGEYDTPFMWWVSRSLGFLIESILMSSVCIVIAKVSHYMLKNLDTARREAKLAEELAKHSDELKAARDEAERARLEAEQANLAKSEFLTNMSHEIRTPLNAVLGMSELIVKESGEDKIKEYAGHIDRAGHTLLSMVNNIMDFSSAEEGAISLSEETYRLGSFLEEIEEAGRRMALEKGLEFYMSVQEGLPDELCGDRRRFWQVVMNVINNAVKYTEKGEVAVTVEQKERRDDKAVLRIAVKDTGIGIRNEDLKHLFRGFERLDTINNRSIQGGGLGLAISRHLLDRMNGSIEVSSEYGTGSEFVIMIPQKIKGSAVLELVRINEQSGGEGQPAAEESTGEDRPELNAADKMEKPRPSFEFSIVTLLMMAFGILLNLGGRLLSEHFALPLWLDAVGTFLVAIQCGPLAAAITGGTLNFVMGFSDHASFAYALVNMGIGLCVGLLYPRNKKKDAFLVISSAVLSGLVAVLLSTPLNMIFYEGYTGNRWGDSLMDMLSQHINIRILCSFLGEAFVDMPDKTLSLVLSLIMIRAMHLFKKRNAKHARTAGTVALIPVMLAGFAASSLYAGAADFNAEYEASFYDTADGLAAMEINAIAQTADGYIWAGTYSGIYRYDGSRFEAVNIDECIRNAMVFFVDRRCRLWIGTNDSGAACYNVVRGEIEFFSEADGLPGNSIRSICEDSYGNIYVGTAAGLCMISSDGEVTDYEHFSEINYIRTVTAGENGIVAGVTNSGTLFFLKDGKLLYSEEYPGGGGIYYSSLTHGEKNEFLVGTSSGVMEKVSFSNGECRHLSTLKSGNISYCNMIRYYPREGGFFICDENGCGFMSDDGEFTDMTRNGFENSVSDVLRDYQGNIWFVSNKQGIIKFSHNPFTDVFKKAGLESSVVNALLLNGDELYVGMDDGLAVLDSRSYKRKPDKLSELLTGIRVRNITGDSKGNIWISTYGAQGLVELKSTGEIVCFNEETASTLGGRFRMTIELPDGSILSASNVGLNYIEDGRVTATIGEGDGLRTPQILCMIATPEGEVLAGSDGDGIYVIKDRKITGHIGIDEGLETLVVLRMIPYRDGYFYVTSNAIYYDDGQGITRLDSFPYSNNYDIYITGDGKAWVSSSAGIYITDADSLADNQVTNYTLLNRSRGFSTSLTANAWTAVDGDRLLLCCNDGVRMVSTGDINSRGEPYQIRVSSVICDGTAYSDSDGRYLIPAGTRRLQIQASVLNYSLSNPLVHIYLDGMDDEGLIVHQNELVPVVYTNLPHGEYNLHLCILDETNGEVIREEVFPLVKDAQLFETRPFKIYLFAVIMIFIGFMAWLVAKLGNMAIINRQYEEIRDARDAAEQANRAKSDFLANISHEIRNPINAVIGMDELILKETDSERVRSYAEHIDRASHTLLSLINDILDFSKIEAGHLELDEADYSMGSLLNEVCSMMEFNAVKKGLVFKVDADPNLPDRLWGDEKRIKQLMMNLLSNAIKYTREGSVSLRIAADGRDGDILSLRVDVKDTGIGIRKEDMHKLFKSFERLDTQKNKAIQGTGLGLSITKRIVQAMGGELEVESEYGKGSCFTLFFTQRVMAEKTMGDYHDYNEVGLIDENMEISAAGAHVLVVDDTEMNLILFEERLRDTGIKVSKASSGEECLAAVRKERFDVIFLDHFMPKMNGLETFERLKAMGDENLSKDAPVIALTANAIAGSREMYLSRGFTDYLSKPVEYRELIATLEKYITVEEKAAGDAEQESGQSEEAAEESPDTGEKLIDKDEGLRYASGKEAFFKKLLGMYCDQKDEKKSEMDRVFAEENIDEYVIMVHALKSNSKMIGAKGLSEAALELELAGKAGNWDKIKEGHGALMKLYDRVVEEGKTML